MPDERFYSPRSNLTLISGAAVCAIGFALTAYITGSYEIAAVWVVFLLLILFSETRMATQLFLFQVGIPILVAMMFYKGYMIIYEVEAFGSLISNIEVIDSKIGVFFQMVATLYAIVTGFTLWRAVADFTELDMMLRREANQINSISCFLDFFDNVPNDGTLKAIKRIRVVLKEYCGDVLVMTAVGGTKENESRIRECIAECEDLKTPEENDRIALDGLIKGLARLSEIRTERITISKLQLSPFLSFLLLLLALITVSFFFMFDAGEIGVSHAIIPILAFIHTFIIVMLMDIYYPYGGYWRANAEPFVGVQERLVFDLENK